jgi:hypothetical protein
VIFIVINTCTFFIGQFLDRSVWIRCYIHSVGICDR